MHIGKKVVSSKFPQLFSQFFEPFCEQFTSSTVLSIYLMVKIGSKLEKIGVYFQAALAELVRIRSSLTSGNLAQVVLGISEKVAYVERRAMGSQCQQLDFWRSLRSEVLSVDWHFLPAGSAAFRGSVLDFVGAKFMKMAMVTDIPKELIDSFRVALKKEIDDEIAKNWMSLELRTMWNNEKSWVDSPEFRVLFHRTYAVWHA